tara:strand:+ start:591 stop:992 length:402 start_codon:yes stop_codon:yes gene_type:complete
MADLSDLFTKTSSVLRDELVSQLKDENTYLKTILYKKTNLMNGAKIKIPIRIIPNYYSQRQQADFTLDISGTNMVGGFDEHGEKYVTAIFIEDSHGGPYSSVLVKDSQQRIRYISVYTRHIEFIDPIINKMLD